jgi:hypothetical protein
VKAQLSKGGVTLGLEQTIADRYIGRDGSPPESQTRRKELTRAAVLAAQAELERVLKSSSPLSDRQMHSVLLAAIKAAPEIFEPSK